jgi:hypothetical protein
LSIEAILAISFLKKVKRKELKAKRFGAKRVKLYLIEAVLCLPKKFLSKMIVAK